METVGYEETVGTLPLGTGQVCRTCLADAADALTWHETVSQHGYTATIHNMLVFLNFIGNEEKEEYPDTVCQSCVTKLMIAYQFKLMCADASATLASLPPPQELPIDFDNLTDLEIIQLDHGYDLPFPNFYSEAIDELNLDSEDDQERYEQNSEDVKRIPPIKEVRKVKQKQQFNCTLCLRSYSRFSSLRDHLATHMDSRDHLCTKCGKSFHSSALLRQHLQGHSSARPHVCTLCNKSYKKRQKLKEHVRVAHSKDRYSHICPDCGKTFTAKSSLVVHAKTHTGQRDYKCEDCPKSFTRAAYLRVHWLSHTEEKRAKPFQCIHEDCDKSFSTKYSMTVHMAHAHSDERDFKCNVCSKSFVTALALRHHRETHFVTFVACIFCGRTLSSKHALKRHLRLHSENRLETENRVN